MAIVPVAHTGVTTATGSRGTTSTTVAFPADSVAPRRFAIITAVAKPSTATFDSVTGWTFFINAGGGTGSQAADTGPTRMGGWRRQLDGTESADVTISATGSGSIAAVMSVYENSGTGWQLVERVTGNDATHDANPSATLATWGNALGAGDYLHLAYSTDTDSTTATGAVTLTQTGATFGTVTQRNRLGNSDGNDSAIMTWSAPVTTGSGNALTFDLTWSASSCGTLAAVRMREVPFSGWGVPV